MDIKPVLEVTDSMDEIIEAAVRFIAEDFQKQLGKAA